MGPTPSEKLSPDELMESGVYQRFNRAIEKIFDNAEEVDVTAEIGGCTAAPGYRSVIRCRSGVHYLNAYIFNLSCSFIFYIRVYFRVLCHISFLTYIYIILFVII